jgi:hypothetical protein
MRRRYQCRKGRVPRLAVVAAIAGAMLLLPGTAQANVSKDCSGSAKIEGVTYTPGNDTPDNPVLVPADQDDVVIPYTGGVKFTNTNHRGAIRLALPIGSVQIASWGDENADDKRETTGEYKLDDFWDLLGGNRITGMYTLTGGHTADGGSCVGFAVVKFTGSPLGTPIGIVVVAGTVITGAMVIWAGVPKKGG